MNKLKGYVVWKSITGTVGDGNIALFEYFYTVVYYNEEKIVW
jgi:hypothetical protein